MKHKALFSDSPGRISNYEHEIRLRDETPFFKKSYPIPHCHRAEVKRQMYEMVDWGVIELAQTEYINPLVVVMKKDGSPRVCLDARHLNSVMIKDHVMPMCPDEFLYNLTQGQIFSTLDLTSSYWQVPIKKENRKYTGFQYEGQTYVFNVLPFGLSTSVASFIRALNGVLGDVESYIMQYVDDLLVYSVNMEQHFIHLELLFNKLRNGGLTVKFKKCEFACKEVSFLGHVLTVDGLKLDEKRIKAIQQFPTPRNVKHLRSFLGMCNYERRFCENYAHMATPLLKLLKKGVSWRWGEEMEIAFKKIKQAYLKVTFVNHPDFNRDYFIQTDSSD